MKKIIDNCCGCGVCEAVCAKKSIALMPDEHGFYKAFLNNDTCVDCGLCVKVCPQRHSIPFISHSVSRHYVAQVADKWCSSTPRPEGWLMNLDDGLSETATKWLVRPMIRNKTEQFGRLPIKSRNFLYLAVPNIFRAFPPALSASSINRINIW